MYIEKFLRSAVTVKTRTKSNHHICNRVNSGQKQCSMRYTRERQFCYAMQSIPPFHLIYPLQIPLLNQSLHIRLSHIQLTILRQRNNPVISTNNKRYDTHTPSEFPPHPSIPVPQRINPSAVPNSHPTQHLSNVP